MEKRATKGASSKDREPEKREYAICDGELTWAPIGVGSPASSRRRSDEGKIAIKEKFSTANVSVWWDYEKCPLRDRISALHIYENINISLRHIGFRKPGVVKTVRVYGDAQLVPEEIRQALGSVNVSFIHVPRVVDVRGIMATDMLMWRWKNPPPTLVLLISGSDSFTNLLVQLRSVGCNILLGLPFASSTPIANIKLAKAADIIWWWDDLCTGGRPFEIKH